MNKFSLIFVSAIAALGIASCSEAPAYDVTQTSKEERNYIKAGNREFNDSNYIEAAAYYNRALALNDANAITKYNYANATRHAFQDVLGSQSPNATKADSIINKSDSIYRSIFANTFEKALREKAIYNSGNITFDREQWQQCIEAYKQALRLNPDNDMARRNLRLAQLKLQEQQNRDNEDNEDNQDNKENQQEQEQEQEQQQQQQQQQQNQQQNQQQQPQQAQQNQSISEENANQILNAVQAAENQTRREKENENPAAKRALQKPW